jgi:dTMP kinase
VFVTFEGGEGSGKSTQVARLRDQMEEAALPFRIFREPGSTGVGETVRALLRRGGLARRVYQELTDSRDWSATTPLAELFLFCAARAQLVEESIRPALHRGEVVVCDRFTDSTLAYQGFGRGLELADIELANRLATGGLQPDATFLLDVPVRLGLERNRGEAAPVAIGDESLEFLERVRAGYRTLAAQDPARWVVLDGTRPPGELAESVWERVQRELSRLTAG